MSTFLLKKNCSIITLISYVSFAYPLSECPAQNKLNFIFDPGQFIPVPLRNFYLSCQSLFIRCDERWFHALPLNNDNLGLNLHLGLNNVFSCKLWFCFHTQGGVTTLNIKTKTNRLHYWRFITICGETFEIFNWTIRDLKKRSDNA